MSAAEDEAAQAKKIALLDGTSTQEAAELLPLVEDLVQEGSYNPIVRVGQDMLTRPGAWVARALVPVVAVFTYGFAIRAWGVASHRVLEYSFMAFLWILLPVWCVTGVGAWMDRLAGRDPGGIRAQLARRGRELVQSGLLAFPVATGVFYGTDALSSWARAALGWSYSGPLALASLVFGSMVWGFFACSLVIRGRAAPMALVEGVVESTALVVRTPRAWYRWLQAPDLRRLQAGEGMMLPYLLFLWVSTAFAAFGMGYVIIQLGMSLGARPDPVIRVLISATIATATALAFEGAVGVGTLNYLALLVERAPPSGGVEGDAVGGPLALEAGDADDAPGPGPEGVEGGDAAVSPGS